MSRDYARPRAKAGTPTHRPRRHRTGPRISRLLAAAAWLAALAPPITLSHSNDPARSGFRRYAVEQGLSQGTINAVVQGHRGFIWIGTYDGLNRFDGVDFRSFRHDPGDPRSLSDSWIISIREDARRRLWIGTAGGLNQFDRGTGTFRRYTITGMDGRPSLSYAVDMMWSMPGDETPLISLSGLGFASVDTIAGKLKLIRVGAPGTQPPTADPASRRWISTARTIYAYDVPTGRISRLRDFQGDDVLCVTPAGDGRLFVGRLSGLFHLDTRTGAMSAVDGVPATRVIESDGRGGFWLATDGGLMKLERAGTGSGTVAWRASPAGLAGIAVITLCVDSTGTPWAGTHDGLFRKLTSSPAFTIYRHRDDDPGSLVSDFVMPVHEDREGRIWFGTFQRGVSVLMPANGGKPRFRNFLPGNARGGGHLSRNVRSILQTGDGKVWLGTDVGLIAYTEDFRVAHQYERMSRSDPSRIWVDALHETRDGTLWAGANPLRVIRVDPAAGGDSVLASHVLDARGGELTGWGVNEIADGAGGMLWIATESGLFRFDPRSGKTLERFFHDRTDSTGLTNNFVWSILVDTAGGRETVWAGTSQGLNRYIPSNGTWTHWFRQEGLPSDWIYGILRDGDGRLWLTTNRGISCFDDSRPAGRKFRNYDVTDGIAGDECNRRAFALLRDGEIVFGGTSGVTRFDPRGAEERQTPPTVVLTAVLNAGKSIAAAVPIDDLRTLRLAHDENDLAFEFAALDYANPAKNRYAFKMEGHDDDWTDVGNRRYAGYAGLGPGRYTFRVKAANSDGVWNESGIALAVEIDPPFWEAWWFIGSGVAFFVLAVVGVFRAREKRAEEMLDMRRKIARNLHDEIGSNLTGIAVSGSLLKDSGKLDREQEGRVGEITSIAIRTSELMRDLIWVVRPENDRLDDLGFKMKDAAGGILAGTKCHFTMPDHVGDRVLNLEVKHNLFLIFKEIINNISRHAGAREVTVALEASDGRLVLTVSDDGVGFDTARPAKGMGLANLAARARTVGGTIAVSSRPGGGTRTTVSVPFT